MNIDGDRTESSLKVECLDKERKLSVRKERDRPGDWSNHYTPWSTILENDQD